MKRTGLLVVIAIIAFALAGACASSGKGGVSGESPMKPGRYTETAFGYLLNSKYEVTVVVDGHEIRDIYSTGTSRDNSRDVGANAIPVLINRILAEQTASVDTVTGATITSLGFLDAVERALQKAGAPERMYQTVVRQPVDLTVDCDVLVIGAGMAGLSAALSAKSAASDKTIVLIDMTEIYGGSSRMSGMVIGLPMTENVADRDEMANWFQARAQGDADMKLLRRWADQSTDAYRLTTGRINQYQSLRIPVGGRMGIWPKQWGRYYFGSESGRSNDIGGGVFVDAIARMVTNAGVVFMTGVRGTELIEDSSRRVTGAKAEGKGINYTFNTRGGVIIATGGFGWDEELMAKYLPGVRGGGANIQQGDGIRMGIQVDADMVFKGTASTRGAVYGDATGTDYWYTQPCITSDGSWAGSYGYYTFDDVLPAQTEDQAQAENYMGYRPPNGLKALTYNHAYTSENADWDLTDEKTRLGEHSFNVMIRTQMQGRFLQDQLAKKDPNMKYFNLGKANDTNALNFPSAKPGVNTWSASSPAALAAAINEPGITAQKLEAAYAGLFEPGSASVYYAIRIEPASNFTPGGLMIDTDARVLRNGSPIPGLYAAGEVASGQFFYRCYPTSGALLSIGMTFGNLAGYHAVTGTSKGITRN
ncbi:MAG: FAD-dependent oxidoreductase [Spirochaetaceae bacterium]|nr:FAD-dependent oxidoreductase [Spirochaetaceae bacterium]